MMIATPIEQRMEPWKGSPDVSKLTFGVMPTANTAAGDIFGRLAFAEAAGVSTDLTVALTCTTTTVTVQSTAAFAASGTVYIGTEAIAYTAKGGGGTTFTGCTRGKYAPLTDDSTGMAHEHRIPVIGEGITMPPKVTSLPRDWVGRWVTVWAHRVVGGVLDVKAQAQRIWAGRITGKRDEANGCAYIDCDSVAGKLRDTTLLRDQYTARVAEGIYLRAGWKFNATDYSSGTQLDATALSVVSSGVGANEILEGLYTLSELLNALNDWLSAEKAAARLNFMWDLGVSGSGTDMRSKFTWSDTTSASNRTIFTAKGAVLNFLGYPQPGNELNNASIDYVWLVNDPETYSSPEEPYRRYMMGGGGGSNVEVENVKGTWWDQSDYLPNSLGFILGSIAILRVNGGPLGVFRYTDADTIVCLGGEPLLDAINGGTSWDDALNFRRARQSDPGDLLLEQVVVVRSRFKWLMLQTLTSTGTADHNYTDPNAHGDVWPSQMGAAIPWEFLGDNFYNSLMQVDELMADQLLLIDKPTKWTEIMGAEMVARQLHFIWKNGGLVLRTWATPTAAHALHTFTESNKAAPVNTQDTQRTVTSQTDEATKNVVKLEYNRLLTGEYRNSITLSDPRSQDAYGAQPVTLKMRNTYGGLSGSMTAVEELADTLAQSMPVFTRPLHILRRSISPLHFENCVPGDFCIITDNHARSPTDGTRGLSSKPGLIIRHRYDWGGREVDTGKMRMPSGEVDILILPLSNISNYSPAAEVDNTQANAGYNAGTKVLTCYANVHSEAGEDADATHFDVGDAVYVVQVDPSDPASFLSWSDTVAGQSGNTITLTTGLAGWSTSYRYRVISDTYNVATQAQTPDTYQADDADGMILDTVNAYSYGLDPAQATEWTDDDGEDEDQLPRLYYNTMYGDGRPLDTGSEYDHAHMINALVNFRCTSQMQTLQRGTAKTYTGTGRKIVEVQPVCFGPGEMYLGDRSVNIGVWCRSSDGTSTTVTVSLCRNNPTGTSFTSTDLTSLDYEMAAPCETWTSAAITSTSYALYENDFSLKTLDPYTGEGFIVVEVASKLETRGIAEIHAGPYVES